MSEADVVKPAPGQSSSILQITLHKGLQSPMKIYKIKHKDPEEISEKWC